MDTAANPLIYKVQTEIPNSGNKIQQAFKKRIGFFIFGILILIIVVELALGVRAVMRGNSQNSVIASSNILPLSDGKILLLPSKKEFRVGEIVPISVKVVTGGQNTDSTDLVLKYDPQVLEASGSSFIRLGKIYKDYPVADYDRTQGLVKISGTTPPDGSGFSGIGNLATLYFTARKAGPATVTIDYENGSTADSNIVLASSTHDILSEVMDADIMIKEGELSSVEENKQTMCPGFYQYCQLGSGLSGKQYCQSGAFQNNQCGFDPNLSVSCSVCKSN